MVPTPTRDPLYPDSSAGRERALIGAKSLRKHGKQEIDEHRRMLGYFKMAEVVRTYSGSQPEPTPAERAALAAILLGGGR